MTFNVRIPTMSWKGVASNSILFLGFLDTHSQNTAERGKVLDFSPQSSLRTDGLDFDKIGAAGKDTDLGRRALPCRAFKKI
jgi:hypothetical protein